MSLLDSYHRVGLDCVPNRDSLRKFTKRFANNEIREFVSRDAILYLDLDLSHISL